MIMRSLAATSVLAAALAVASASSASVHLAGPTAPVLKNGSFELPPLSTGAYQYSGAASWTTGGAVVNAAGSSAWYGGTPPAAVDGSQFLALQGGSGLSQTFTATDSTMQLSWLSGGRPGSGSYGGDQTYTVSVSNSAAPVGTYTTQNGSAFATETATVTGLKVGQTYTLTFQGTATTDQTAFIDRVELNSHNILQNGGFESTNLGAGNYAYTSPTGWTSTGALINAAAPSAWGAIPAGYGGSQFVGLQGISTLSQQFTVSNSGKFELEWLSGGRSFNGCCNGNQSYTVSVDGVLLGTYTTTSGQAFTEDSIYLAGLTPGLNTLTFQGLSTSDNTAYLDNVSLSAVPEPATWMLMLVGVGLLGGVFRWQARTNRELEALRSSALA